MTLTVKQITIGSLLFLIIGLAAGRYTLPSKVVTKTEVKIVEKEVVKFIEKKNQEEKRDKTTKVIETILPDGTKKIETSVVDKTELNSQTNTDISSTKEHSSQSVTVTKTINGKLNVSALFAVSKPANILDGSVKYGAMIQYKVLGPVNVGAFGLTNGFFGFTLGSEL